MDTLHERLAELADAAPTGGAPPAALWTRGKRAHRVRAAAVAVTVLVLGAVGTGIGVRLADGGGGAPDPAPAGGVGVSLPIEYPVGEELPELGDAPGPLAAVWLAPGDDAPELVGLVAETGAFGTLPIDVSYDDRYEAHHPGAALSPEGRMIAYDSPGGELTIRDLMSGETYSSPPWFKTGAGYTWIEDTTLGSSAPTLVGRVAGESDIDGWVWEPGAALKLVNLRTGEFPNDAVWLSRPGVDGPGTRDWWVADSGGGPRSCSPPIIDSWGRRSELPLLCDVLHIGGSDVLGHWKDPRDGNGTVVSLDPIPSALADPRVVVTAGAPERVRLATDLIRELLVADSGAS